jgi:hypothetical protein
MVDDVLRLHQAFQSCTPALSEQLTTSDPAAFGATALDLGGVSPTESSVTRFPALTAGYWDRGWRPDIAMSHAS